MSDKNSGESNVPAQVHTPRSKSIGNPIRAPNDGRQSPEPSLTPQTVIQEIHENLEFLETSQPAKTKLNTGNRTIIARSQSVPIQMIMKGLELLYPTQPKPSRLSPKSRVLLELWRRKMQLTAIHLEESMTVSALG